jgi:hypothetical protein
VQFEFSQKWRYARQVPAATANNKLTSGLHYATKQMKVLMKVKSEL